MKGWMGLAVMMAVAGMPLMAQGQISVRTNASSAQSSMAVGEPVYFNQAQSKGFAAPIAVPIREFEKLTGFDADFWADIEQALAKQRIASSAQTKQADAASEVLLSAEGALEAGDDTFGDEERRLDLYAFEGEAGQVVTLTVESDGFTPITVLFEITTDGAEAIASVTSEDGTTATVTATLPSSGQYIVGIGAFEIPGEGTYRLSVTTAGAAASQQVEQQAEADRLVQQGIQQYRTSQFRSALESWQQALKIYQAIGNRQGEAYSLSNLGLVYSSLSQYEQAIELYQQSLEIKREIGDRQGEANSLGNLGNVYDALSQYQQAIEFHQQSLDIARDLGDRQGEADSLNNLGLAYRSLGQYERAIAFYQQSLEIKRDIGDRQGEARSLGNMGNAYTSLSQYDQAIRLHQQSLEIKRDIGDRRGEAKSLANIGIAYASLGQYEQAIEFYQQSLDIVRDIGDRQTEAVSLNNIGIAYRSLGRYGQAIEFYQQSLDITRDIGDRQTEAGSLSNLGNIYISLGQYQRAIEFHQQSLDIARDIGDRYAEAVSLSNLGLSYRHIGQYQQAIELHQQSLAIDHEIGDRQGEAVSLGNLGLINYRYLGQYQRSIELHQQSLAIKREIGDRQGEADSLANLGNVYSALGQYRRSIELHQQSLAIEREIGDRQGEAISLNNLGSAHININRLAEAEAVLSQSIEAYEALRVDLSDAQLIAIADTQSQAYNNLERALIAQNKTLEALAITERGRAQAFALQLAIRQGESFDAPVTYPSVADIQRIAAEQNTTIVEYSIVFDETLHIWVISPSGDIQFRQVSLADLSADTLTVFIQQTRNSLGVRGNRNASAAPQYNPEFIARRQAETDQNLKDLHNLLIEPIADLLPTDPEANVVFIPQGELFLVPFPALKDESGTYLIEKHTISTAPSIQVLGLAGERERGNRGVGSGLRREPSRTGVGDALIIGNPTMPTVTIADESGLQDFQLTALPGAQREARAIGEFLGITPLIGSQATEAQVKAQLPNVDLIHLATHGLLEYGDPQALAVRDFPGAIALAPGNGEDGLLTASEILDMDLQASLAVLSACDTGRGRITGDGVVGLSRSLITAGVSSVVVSLWAVPDSPTADLMSEFYRQLDQGQPKAQALRQAMLTTMETHRDPRDWAAFTLIGESE